ncbi:hypothetical protein HZA75_06315 [Candidatus Roizmanbacteria bacterium]|nr:hypothetical protein [Candidatus Roizmanbacteria bacterium]
MEEAVRRLESTFSPDKVAVTMTTSYPGWYSGELRSIGDTDKVRGDIALEMIRLGIDCGFNLVVSDFRSAQAFMNELVHQPITLAERVDLDRASGRRQVITLGSKIPGVEIIIRTEPEKDSLLQSIDLVSHPILSGDADIVIPKRNPADFERTYPAYMHESEIDANARFNRLLRMVNLRRIEDPDLDIFFGPTVIANRPEILSLFEKDYEIRDGKVFTAGVRKYLAPGNFSNAQSFSVIEALDQGLRVASVEVPFEYPARQRKNELAREDEFMAKRREQKWGIVDEALSFIKYLRDPQNPKNVLVQTNK